MHWPDDARDGRAGDYVRLIGAAVHASGADPPAPHDRFGCRHRNPPLCVRETRTEPAIQRRASKTAAGQGENYLTRDVSTAPMSWDTRQPTPETAIEPASWLAHQDADELGPGDLDHGYPGRALARREAPRACRAGGLTPGDARRT
jgi:hypothetical protein